MQVVQGQQHVLHELWELILILKEALAVPNALSGHILELQVQLVVVNEMQEPTQPILVLAAVLHEVLEPT